jgi:hypothetical protein
MLISVELTLRFDACCGRSVDAETNDAFVLINVAPNERSQKQEIGGGAQEQLQRDALRIGGRS